MEPNRLTDIAEHPDTDGAVKLFLEALPDFGFHAAAAGGWTGAPGSEVHRFYFNTWPDDWMQLYTKADLFRRDPVVAHASRVHTPFLWSEAEATLRTYPGGPECMALGAAYGWKDVLSVPVHVPGRYQGLVTMATTRAVVLTPGARTWLGSLARAIHDRCHATPGFGQRMPEAAALTPRQLSCLRAVAKGMSDKEIGRELGLSPATAHYHIENAKRALRARTRAEAVSILTLDGVL